MQRSGIARRHLAANVIKLTLSFKGRILRVFHSEAPEIRIGRGPDCDIRIDNLGVSPLHARIEVNTECAVIHDASEDQGLVVNGKPVEKAELAHGDTVTIGKHTLLVAWEEPAPRSPAAEAGVPAPLDHGWLQFLNGPKLGRTIRLNRSLVRLGKSGKHGAMIANRSDGYYISHLEGEPPTLVDGQAISDQSRKLEDGSTIQIGSIQMLFFTEPESR